ncbi:transposase [Amycolatopsis sp. cmx-4-83]|uniref:transposase n=1 Tax=Amycolatopsis sp. cmx-4-83 TaxID=2790940 RepID=UPI00397ADC6F
MVIEGITHRYRCGIAWRDAAAVFGPWQTIWTWHRRMTGDGTWDTPLRRLLTEARAHQHATDITRPTGSRVELHGTADRAA